MIVFDHLRKTGGTFLKWEFARRLNYAWFYPSGVRHDFSVQPRRGLQFICGHDRFSDLESDGSTFFFTFLRNPVDVVYSAANAHHRNLLRDGKTSEPRERFVERRVAAILDDEASLGWTWRTKAQWSKLDLERYDFVGVQEEMETSLAQLGRAVGLDLANRGRRNQSGGRHTHRRAELSAFFAAEIELWREARRRLLSAATAPRCYDLTSSRKLECEAEAG